MVLVHLATEMEIEQTEAYSVLRTALKQQQQTYRTDDYRKTNLGGKSRNHFYLFFYDKALQLAKITC